MISQREARNTFNNGGQRNDISATMLIITAHQHTSALSHCLLSLCKVLLWRVSWRWCRISVLHCWRGCELHSDWSFDRSSGDSSLFIFQPKMAFRIAENKFTDYFSSTLWLYLGLWRFKVKIMQRYQEWNC
jgi:hypothetical protein